MRELHAIGATLSKCCCVKHQNWAQPHPGRSSPKGNLKIESPGGTSFPPGGYDFRKSMIPSPRGQTEKLAVYVDCVSGAAILVFRLTQDTSLLHTTKDIRLMSRPFPPSGCQIYLSPSILCVSTR